MKAVLDFVAARRDLDSSRIGMWGVSLGGYYAPRAAAFDKRIKACIALGGPFNWGANWDKLPELTREAFRVRSHCATQEEAKKNAATLSLEGIAQNITCPIFIVNGRLDRIVPAADAERLAREVKGPATLMMIEDGNHIATNRAYRWRSQSADWMAEQLGRSSLHRGGGAARPRRERPAVPVIRRSLALRMTASCEPSDVEASMPVSVISTISPVCTPALPSRVTTLGWITTVCPARNGASGTGPAGRLLQPRIGGR